MLLSNFTYIFILYIFQNLAPSDDLYLSLNNTHILVSISPTYHKFLLNNKLKFPFFSCKKYSTLENFFRRDFIKKMLLGSCRLLSMRCWQLEASQNKNLKKKKHRRRSPSANLCLYIIAVIECRKNTNFTHKHEIG